VKKEKLPSQTFMYWISFFWVLNTGLSEFHELDFWILALIKEHKYLEISTFADLSLLDSGFMTVLIWSVCDWNSGITLFNTHQVSGSKT
jgi:hypothetical protein